MLVRRGPGEVIGEVSMYDTGTTQGCLKPSNLFFTRVTTAWSKNLNPLILNPTPQLLHRNVQRFRGGLVFKAHRLLYHSTLGLRAIKKKKTETELGHTAGSDCVFEGSDHRRPHLAPRCRNPET